MQFLDEVTITVASGKGGDGVVSARRESGVPFGGPAGGNGGNGGSVVLQASKDENTLLAFKYKKNFKAKHGESGRSKEQFGANAEDLTLKVPVGTLVRDAGTGRILHHFSEDGELRVAAKGGQGGLGNMMFKDAVNQYPNFALLGEPGHIREVQLELQLFADVALIGTPSVGKSSIINTVANTKAKVADYPFTTLVPHLGSVMVGKQRFNIVDVPGLVAGAAQGKGLGNKFLRHILKARVLCIVTDLARYDQGITEAALLLEELKQYIEQKFIDAQIRGQEIDAVQLDIYADEKQELINFEVYSLQGNKKTILMKKYLQFVCNKYDLVMDDEIVTEYKHALRKDINNRLAQHSYSSLVDNILFHNTFILSAATHYGVEDWLEQLAHAVALLPLMHDYIQKLEGEVEQEDFITDITDQEKQKLIDEEYLDPLQAKHVKIRYIRDPEVAKLVYQLQRNNDEAEMRFRKTLEHKGFLQQLESAGVYKNDVLKIKSYYEGIEDRYILY